MRTVHLILRSGLPFLAALSLSVLPACAGRTEKIVILSRALKQQSYTSTAAPSEFGSVAGLNGTIYYVEGQVKNTATVDARHLEISFPCKAGVERRVLTAEIPVLPAGKTVTFSTQQFESKVKVTLIEEEAPEITMDR